MTHHSLNASLKVLILMLSLAFTSCIEIEEYYKINRDGSGRHSTTMKMGGMFRALDDFAAAGGGMGDTQELFDSLVISMQDDLNEKKRLGLIRNISLQADPETYVLSFAYDFDNVAAVTQTYRKEISGDQELTNMLGGNRMIPAVLALNKNLFTKDVNEDRMKSLTPEEKQQMQSMSSFFSEMKYTTSFEFEQTVKKAKGENVVVSSDKHQVIQEFDWDDFLTGRAISDLSVKLK